MTPHSLTPPRWASLGKLSQQLSVGSQVRAPCRGGCSAQPRPGSESAPSAQGGLGLERPSQGCQPRSAAQARGACTGLGCVFPFRGPPASTPASSRARPPPARCLKRCRVAASSRPAGPVLASRPRPGQPAPRTGLLRGQPRAERLARSHQQQQALLRPEPPGHRRDSRDSRRSCALQGGVAVPGGASSQHGVKGHQPPAACAPGSEEGGTRLVGPPTAPDAHGALCCSLQGSSAFGGMHGVHSHGRGAGWEQSHVRPQAGAGALSTPPCAPPGPPSGPMWGSAGGPGPGP